MPQSLFNIMGISISHRTGDIFWSIIKNMMMINVGGLPDKNGCAIKKREVVIEKMIESLLIKNRAMTVIMHHCGHRHSQKTIDKKETQGPLNGK